MKKKMYTIKEACTLLAVDRSTMYRYRQNGIITAVVISPKKILISSSEIDRLLHKKNND